MTSLTTLTLLTHLFLILTNNIHSLTSDGLTLLSLKSAIEPATSGISPFSNWVESDPNPCKWSGITCNNSTNGNEPRVTGISIANRGLHGYIPSELGSLTYLRRLNLHNNQFYGSIPDQLFNATSLHSIFLYGNNLSGPLPSSLCKLPKLQNLDISTNSLSGEIPKSLKDCKQLQRLILSNNKFSDQIPTGIWSEMMNLVQLDLSDNQLTGKIPDDLGELQSLSGTLNLSFNHLSGEIPKKLGELPMTVSIDLRSNNLSGEIPQTGSFANQGPTAFLGNPFLCGFPLQRACKHDQTVKSPGSEKASGNSSGHKGLSAGLILLISAADAMAVAIVGLFIIYLYWKKKDNSNGCSCTGTIKLGSKTEHPNLCFCCFTSKNDETNDTDSEKGSSYEDGNNNRSEGDEGELVAIDKGFQFELDELLRASAYVLGKSGLGIVYKVVLGNGVPVAVRRLGEGGDQQRYKEFASEIQAIGKIKHPNVVRLRAYYWAPDEKLLISDYISNGNLASALRGKTGQTSTTLTWTTRLKIAKGTARGLAYIHECSPRKFVHGDIKPSNILLDNENHPYISDFGLNRLISITGGATTSSAASSGGFMGGALPYIKSTINPDKPNFYRAPEARVPGGRPTQKWDVYSFGVVLLELLTGKSTEYSPPTTSSSIEIHDLVRWVRKGFDNECPLSEMVDPVLLQEVHAKKEVMSVFHVALSCTQSDPEIRPRMKIVAENLDKI